MIAIDKIVRSRRRSIALEVRKDATLFVRAPYFVSKEVIARLVEGKKQWILRKQLLMQQQKIQAPIKQFVDGEYFLYLGEQYRLAIVDGQCEPLRLESSFLLSRGCLSRGREVFANWYKREAAQKIAERVNCCTVLANIAYADVRITDVRQSWGSCNRKGDLSFSWRLVMAPLEVIDYVVAHEVAHLSEKNHSRNFWGKVAALLPKYKECKKWLNDNGHRLVL